MDYSFSIRRKGERAALDLCTEYRCWYLRMTNVFEKGEIKNAYTEDYPEADGVRLHLPEVPAHKTIEHQLTLLFDSQTAAEDSRRLISDLEGREFQWYDNFRGVYLLCVLLKPTVTTGRERLYGNRRYREVTLTFLNVNGTYSTTPYYD